MTKYGVIFGPNTGKYGPEITSYLGAFHAVMVRNNFHSNHSTVTKIVRARGQSVLSRQYL